MQRLFWILLLAISFTSASAQSLKLFSSEMKAGAPRSQAVVMDFMERYFNALKTQKQTSIQTKMADDKVFFRQGTLSDLSQVSDTMPISISLVDKHYEVTWQKDSLPFINVVFPAQYDLLLGMKNLGYANFRGSWPNDVNGRMEFTSTHVIDSKDPKNRMASPGDYVIGEWSDGHLVQGIWYGSDNQVKGSILIGK